jgi:hypothetical protein
MMLAWMQHQRRLCVGEVSQARALADAKRALTDKTDDL